MAAPIASDARILGLATALPPTSVSNEAVAARIGVSEDWIVSRTGIHERRRAAPGDRLSDLAAEAGRLALARAGVAAADLDLVLVGTMTPDEITPNTAPIVAHDIGATRAGAIDIGAACTAWLSALSLGAGLIDSGRAERVLLIGADFVSRITDHDDRRTAALFADGAGAVVLARTDVGGQIGPVILRSDGEQAQTIHATHEDRKLRMDGPETFRHAVKNMTQVTRDAVAAAALTLDDIDLFVYHQANGRILSAVAARLGLEIERVVDCIGTLGNTSAATIPLGLAAAEADGRLRPGSTVLLSAFGAGFTWGGVVVEWGEASVR